MPEIFDRYMAGEHHDAWRELTGYSEWIKLPEYLDDAHAVARETMRRISGNLDLLIPRLLKMGYRFGELPKKRHPLAASFGPVRTMPDAESLGRLNSLLATTCPIPLSLQYWFAVVGGVNLCGYHPKWPAPEKLDALCLTPLSQQRLHAYLKDFRTWKTDPAHPCHKGQYELQLAPGHAEKAGHRKGSPGSMRVGLLIMDDIFINDWRPISFIGYLRETLSCGGFPGLMRDHQDHAEMIAQLTEGFAAF